MLEAIVRAEREDGFLGRYTGPPEHDGQIYSLEEAAGKVGADVAVLTRLAETARLVERRDLLSKEDLTAFAGMKVGLDAGFPEEAMRQLVRVYVDALGRVADAENRLFHFYVHDRLKAQGVSGRTLLEAGEALRERLMPLIEPMIRYFHRQAWTRAQMEDAVLHFRENATPPAIGDAPGQLDVAIAFVDLAGFTSLTEAMGDQAAAEVLERFSQVVRDAVGRSQGRVVKQIGDAFMLVFSEAHAAVACALDIESRIAEEPQLAAVRSGIHCGRVLYREGDYVGTCVNVAARLAAAAERHQILVTAAVVREAAGVASANFVALGPRRFRGLGDDVEVFAATPRDATTPAPARMLDPVCGMELTGEAVAARLTLAGSEYVFCSEQCLKRFASAPERYAARSSST
jgi:class 3 adenylate cyclase/YHS domain-containing protein